MIIALLAVPLTLQVAVADSVPNWDVTPSCRGAAEAGYMKDTSERLKTCLDSEQRTRQQLSSQWTTFNAADRVKCVESIRWFEPTYTELAACLDMSTYVRNGQGEEPAKRKK